MQDLYFSKAASAAGITTVAAYQLWSQPHEDPVWRDVVPHFRHLSSQELQPFEKAGIPKLLLIALFRPSLLQAPANVRVTQCHAC